MSVLKGSEADMVNQKTEDEGPDNRVHLRRSISLVPAVSFIVGSMVGSGIFIAPKGVHINTGSVGLSLLVWALCGLLSTFGALCYAELGTSFKKSGAHYTYLLETLGPLPAFLRLWSEFIFIRPAVTAYIALAFGHYVVEPFFTPCPAPLPLIKLTSFLGVTFLVAVNCWSVSLASRMQVVLLIVKLFALVLIIVPGVMALAQGRTENFENAFKMESLSLAKLPLAFYSGLYAYSGWFALNFVTEEVIDPKRNIPLAISLSMVTVTTLYVLVNVAYYTVITEDELLRSDAVAVVDIHQQSPAQDGVSGAPTGGHVLSRGHERRDLFSTENVICGSQRKAMASYIFHDTHTKKDTDACCSTSVPSGVYHAGKRRHLSADQLCLVLALALYRHGYAGAPGPSQPIPGPSEGLQGSSGGSCDLHGGVFLYRGSVSVFRPLEHRLQFGRHSYWNPCLLPDHKALVRPEPVEKSLQLLQQTASDLIGGGATGSSDILNTLHPKLLLHKFFMKNF